MAKVDNSGLEMLRARINQALTGPQKQQFFEDSCREMAARFLTKVIKRTPVGDGVFEAVRNNDGTYAKGKNGKPKLKRLTNGGTLRRGWTATSEGAAKSGGQTNPMQFSRTIHVSHQGNYYIIVVKNPVSYASYVEYGHRQQSGRFVPVLGKKLKKSWVRGQFMMTKSAKELSAQAPAILQRKLDKFLREVFDGQ